jgi:SagB-type dehydrogenase family enzyme
MRLFLKPLIFIVVFSLVNEGAVLMAKPDEIRLPKPLAKGSMSLEEAISKRRSVRSFSDKDLNLEHLSQLLWAAQGITGTKNGVDLRSAPSAGALYPMEIYLLTKDGLFHYIPQGHKLEILADRDLRSSLCAAAWGQAAIGQAAADIVICAVYSRVTSKYGQRGMRYVDMEAGHIAQNIHLEAAAQGLGSVPIGAFDDEQAAKALSLPADCEPLYIIPIGYMD